MTDTEDDQQLWLISGNSNQRVDPFVIFSRWYNLAQQSEVSDANAMVVASLDQNGYPNARIVLLKGYDETGFRFFTNFNSQKGMELQNHPKASLCFHWKSLKRQIRIKGDVEVVTDEEANAYFNSRPRESQIGAWASLQSEPLASREVFEQKIEAMTEKYKEALTVPRPPHWSGFRVCPTEFEFWQDRPFRLHDRVRMTRPSLNANWQIQRLYP